MKIKKLIRWRTDLLFVVSILVPVILFVGGSFVLSYPITLGVLYAINVSLIYLVLWSVFNQALKISSQKMRIEDNRLFLMRKQLYMSFPLIKESDIEINLADIRGIEVLKTGVGYKLRLRFLDNQKLLGIDLDINPLNKENAEMIGRITGLPGVTVEGITDKILEEFESEMTSWKTTYVASAMAIFLALAVFVGVSFYLSISLF